MFLLNILILSVFVCPYKIIIASQTNFQVKSYKLCNNTQGLIKYRGNISQVGNNFFTTGEIILPFPLDENIGFTCKIESLVVATYMEIFTIREKYLCKAANMYLSEFWYDLERAAQILPRKCPIAEGRYELHNYKLEFDKIALQTFPFGYLRFTAKAVDNKNLHNNLFCIELEVQNVPN